MSSVYLYIYFLRNSKYSLSFLSLDITCVSFVVKCRCKVFHDFFWEGGIYLTPLVRFASVRYNKSQKVWVPRVRSHWAKNASVCTKGNSDTGTRTRVTAVRGPYDNHLHHIGSVLTLERTYTYNQCILWNSHRQHGTNLPTQATNLINTHTQQQHGYFPFQIFKFFHHSSFEYSQFMLCFDYSKGKHLQPTQET